MNFFFKAKEAKQQPSNPLHHVMNNLQTHFANFLQIPSSAFHSKRDHDQNSLQNGAPPPPWARIADQFSNNINKITFSSSSSESSRSKNGGPSSNIDLADDPSCKKKKKNTDHEIKERLGCVPVYTMGIDQDSAVASLVSYVADREAILCFFSEPDAQACVSRLVTGSSKNAARGVVSINVPLAQALDTAEEDQKPIRLVPDTTQVKNALKERNKAGLHGDTFSGVPVFQSDAVRVIFNENHNYPAAFFRKEDLENALHKEKILNHTDIESEIVQVTALEDIIEEMKDCSTKSKWNDVVFVPPGWKNIGYTSKIESFENGHLS